MIRAIVLGAVACIAARANAQVRDTVRQVQPDTIAAKTVSDSSRRPLRLCAAGDVTLGNNLDSAWARRAHDVMEQRFARDDRPDSLLSPLRPFFSDADVILLNVEGAIGAGPAVKKCGPRSTSCYAFRMPLDAATAIRNLGGPRTRVVGNVANNHSHDAGNLGAIVTQGLLDSAGVQVTGADTLATVVVTPRGDTLAFLGFYTGSDTPDARDFPAVRRHVRRAVDLYRTVIVTMHLGAEGAAAQRTRNVDEKFVGMQRGNPVGFALTAINAGATAVIGHGPHVLRGGEWRDSSLVLYSLGNFVNYGTFSLNDPMNRGAVACMNILGPRKVAGASLQSTVQIAPGVVLPDWMQRSASLVDSLSRLDFPATGIAVDVDGTIAHRAPIVPVKKRRP